MNKRVFVGTLHTNEGDFDRCRHAIATQEGVTVTHHVISGLDEIGAHNALWKAWRDNDKDHDIFVKVDADTVLRDNKTLETICTTLDMTGASGLQAPLHDYMTDSLIDGLNAYTKRVVFLESQDSLFCDRGVYVGNSNVAKGIFLPPELRPAGYHCHYATGLQAFRYAIHRAMKDQRELMQQLIYAWRKHGDRVRGLGVIGIMIAKRFAERDGHKGDYSDPGFMAAYADAEARYDDYIQAINENRLDVFD